MSITLPFAVTCPSCASEFRVDPLRVPAEGVPAICSTCLRVFRVDLPEPGSAGAQPPTAVDPGGDLATDPVPWGEMGGAETHEEVAPEDGSEEVGVLEEGVESEESEGLEREEEGASPEWGETEEMPSSEGSPPVPPTAHPAPEPPGGELTGVEGSALSQGAARFGRRDPMERARRLARVLVSDMITYHPARYEEGLENDTLRELFAEEVEKSWQEFVDQVGEEVAEASPFFVDALNEILSRGRPLYQGPGRPR